MRELRRRAARYRLNPDIAHPALPQRVGDGVTVGHPTDAAELRRPVANHFRFTAFNAKYRDLVLAGRLRTITATNCLAVRRDVRIEAATLGQTHRLATVDTHPIKTRRTARAKDDRAAVRRERRLLIADAMSQLHGMLAVDIDAPKMFLIVSIGKKDYVSAVGRHNRLLAETCMRRQLFRRNVRLSYPKILLTVDLRRVDDFSIRRPGNSV